MNNTIQNNNLQEGSYFGTLQNTKLKIIQFKPDDLNINSIQQLLASCTNLSSITIDFHDWKEINDSTYKWTKNISQSGQITIPADLNILDPFSNKKLGIYFYSELTYNNEQKQVSINQNLDFNISQKSITLTEKERFYSREPIDDLYIDKNISIQTQNDKLKINQEVIIDQNILYIDEPLYYKSKVWRDHAHIPNQFDLKIK